MITQYEAYISARSKKMVNGHISSLLLADDLDINRLLIMKIYEKRYVINNM